MASNIRSPGTLDNFPKKRISYTHAGGKDQHGAGIDEVQGGIKSKLNIKKKNVTVKIKINDKLTNSNKMLPGANEEDYILLEDYDADLDAEFVRDELVPYLRDLYKDLLMRSNQPEHIDKVTFIEYTKLPGIINDRLHVMFSDNYNKDGQSPTSAIYSIPKSMTKEAISEKKKHEYVTMQSFI